MPGQHEEVFAFLSDAANLELLTPPFLRFRILTPLPFKMRSDVRIDYTLALLGVPFGWRTCITEWLPGKRFVDEQEKGPYALWRHIHSFEPRGNLTVVRDEVEYAMPWGPLGAIAHGLFVKRTLERIFDYRRLVISRVLGIPTAPHTEAGEAHRVPAEL